MKTSVILLSAIAAYLFLNLFLLPGTPILLDGDQVYFWVNGQRLLGGELPYRDFFQYTPPGTDLFYWAVFRLFGTRVWVLNASVVLLGVGLSWVCYDIARKVMDRSLAVLGTVVFVTLIYSDALNGTHHWFSVLAIMGAVTALIPEVSSRRLFTSGVLLAVAAFFTQTNGAVALVAISMFLKIGVVRNQSGRSFWRMERLLLAGFTLAFVSLNLYFFATAGWKELLYQEGLCAFLNVAGPETPLLGMPIYATMRGLPLGLVVLRYSLYVLVYITLPVTYVWVGIRLWRKWSASESYQPAVALVGIVGAFLFVEQLFSLNWLRLYTIALPAMVLVMWLISTSPRTRRYAVGGISLAFLGLAGERVWLTQDHNYIRADLPAGRCVMDHADYEELTWLMQHTKAGDFLFEANSPRVYVPLHLRNPVFLDTAASMTGPLWAARAVQQLQEKRVHYVIWDSRFNYPVDPRHRWTNHIVPLRNYLRAYYQPAKTFPNGEQLWEKKEFSGSSIARR